LFKLNLLNNSLIKSCLSFLGNSIHLCGYLCCFLFGNCYFCLQFLYNSLKFLCFLLKFNGFIMWLWVSNFTVNGGHFFSCFMSYLFGFSDSFLWTTAFFEAALNATASFFAIAASFFAYAFNHFLTAADFFALAPGLRQSIFLSALMAAFLLSGQLQRI